MGKILCYDSGGNLLKTLYQWDFNQTITVTGVPTPPIPVFHFCNCTSSEALVVTPEISENGALTAPVPNILLQQPEPIIAYLYSDTADDGSRTVHAIRIPVVPRPEPEDYEYQDNAEYISAALINNRLSTLIASLTDDSGSGTEAEVADMRIGADGTVYQTAGDALRATEQAVTDLRTELRDYIDNNALDGIGLYYSEEESLLYLTKDGDIISDPVRIVSGSGGGGGGGGYTYVMTLQNIMESRELSVAEGASAVVAFTYSSIDEDNMDDGPGVGMITVNNSKKQAVSIRQGSNLIDVTSLLDAGDNRVVIRVENSEGSVKSLTYIVHVVTLSLTTTFVPLASYTGSVDYAYTPIGTGTKTVYFIMDGVQIGTDTVTANKRSQTFTIPRQSYGGHVFECYATITQDGVTLTSNVLRHAMLWTDGGTNTPGIASTFDRTSAKQGETLIIPLIAYDPVQETAQVTLTVFDSDNHQYSTDTRGIGRLPYNWTLEDYPAGDILIRLSCGSAVCDFPLQVEAYTFPVQPVTDRLTLEFTAAGRSNSEANPGHWNYENIEATFEGFGWTVADGWVTDDDGATVLRFLPGDTMEIPFRPFAVDARENGLTIEVEMATRDVRDYDSIVLECMNGSRGFRIASQEARLASEQSQLSMLFKEDSRVRVTFSVEPRRNANRLIYIYINGVMCGVTQYPENDNFEQASPAGITIGAESCGLDLYKIRCYGKGLTREEQLDNFIVDRSTLAERNAAYQRNDILDPHTRELTIDTLPKDLPYIVLTSASLPESKEDADVTATIEFVDSLHNDRSWTAQGVKVGIQGTSSAVYPVKNWKFKLKNGITYKKTGETDVGFPIHVGELPTKTICFKADYASSENANNIVLAMLYNDICPYRTPPQQADSRVRQGVDGFSTILFWHDTSTNETRFLCKGNCNVDKGNDDIFGFTSENEDAQSWEFLNNISHRVLFKSADFQSMDVDNKGNPCRAWQNDFEARYPDDDDDMTDADHQAKIANWASVVAWVVSTDRDATDDEDEKTARLQKFQTEFSQHFVPEAIFFYYVFTETFLLMDNRAKNMFMTTYDGQHWFTLPYDFDSSLGINNEGALVFEYNLEDTDIVDGSEVFTGQKSVFWNNVRDAFPNELAAMYVSMRNLRDGDPSHESPFSYYRVAKLFTEHQSVWPEAMWNEDAFVKYIQPYLIDGKDYLSRLQGNKASQRDWWLFNAFRYRDSKYQCGDAMSKRIILRAYAKADITITPYSHIYGHVRYGSYHSFHRCTRNVPCVMECNADTTTDLETYIYSADRLASVGDLSPLMVGEFEAADAVKLQSIKLGDESPLYDNPNLGKAYSVTVGRNELLESVNVANCSGFGTGAQKYLVLDGCTGLKEVIATGTRLHGVTLPNGGHLQTLKLPASLTNFTILNQQNLTTLYFEGYGNLETLRVENTPDIPIETLILQNPNLSRVRLIDVDWTVTDAAALQDIYDRLTEENGQGARIIGGLDADDNNLPQAVVSGVVRVGQAVPAALLAAIGEDFPDLVVIANGEATLTVRFRNWDGSVFSEATQTCSLGGSVLDPVASGLISAPTRPAANRTYYTYAGWDKELTDITKNLVVNAVFTEEAAWVVTFVNDDAAHTPLWTEYVLTGGNAHDPVANNLIDTPTKATDAQYVYTYLGWNSSLNNITADRTITARYATEASVTVIFANWDGTELIRKYIERGGTVTDPVTAEEIETPTRPRDTTAQRSYVYAGWDTPLNAIAENTTITATYTTTEYFIIRFRNPNAAQDEDLFVEYVNRGGNVYDPVVNGDIETPSLPPEPTYNYIYKGWDAPMATNVGANITYTAQYKTDRQFVVTFVNWDGVTLNTQLVYDEDDAVDPVENSLISQPARASTAQYSYTYTGWSGTYTFVKADTTITATYTETVRSYTYRFLNNDGTVLKSGTANYGTTVTPPANPSYVPTNEDMVFSGWYPSDMTLVANTDYAAQYIDTSALTVKYLKRTLTDYVSQDAASVAAYTFYDNNVIETATTTATTIGTYAFYSCANLTTVDLTSPSGAVTIASAAFIDCHALRALVIRSNSVASLANADALMRTSIRGGDGGIFVPVNLVDSYKSATNWSTYASQIYPISAYPMTDFSTITDSWSEIFAAEANGTYSTRYHVGDTKKLEIGDTYVYMQIAAMDADELSAGGTAKITWVSKQILSDTHRMHDISDAKAGWATSGMRTWLRETVLPTIQSEVRGNIKEVTKTYRYAPSDSAAYTGSVADTIWILSKRELYGEVSGAESSGVDYTALYNSDANRVKRKINGTTQAWWTRTGYNTFQYVTMSVTSNDTASNGKNGATTIYPIAIGFCT